MSKIRRIGVMGTCGLLAAMVPAAGVGAGERTRDTLVARLDGDQERPAPGDPDGRGVAVVKVDTEAGTICYRLTAKRIDPAVMAHIHVGVRGTSGPVVQDLLPPTDGKASSCVQNAALAEELLEDPSEYYVNVHNSPYPGGAIRGQLR
jgi:hypothetical protein